MRRLKAAGARSRDRTTAKLSPAKKKCRNSKIVQANDKIWYILNSESCLTSKAGTPTSPFAVFIEVVGTTSAFATSTFVTSTCVVSDFALDGDSSFTANAGGTGAISTSFLFAVSSAIMARYEKRSVIASSLLHDFRNSLFLPSGLSSRRFFFRPVASGWLPAPAPYGSLARTFGWPEQRAGRDAEVRAKNGAIGLAAKARDGGGMVLEGWGRVGGACRGSTAMCDGQSWT
mmetsp:Transcript_12926/g.32775  ORF Transcript_12926/g.32775 Transcript_12926/m.32775 type:complete len:231 (+) Transcript_12926:798-1490(+)